MCARSQASRAGLCLRAVMAPSEASSGDTGRESASESVSPGTRETRTGLLWAVGIVVSAGFLVALGMNGSTPPGPYFGTRLGMSERAVRDRFAGSSCGSFEASQRQGLRILTWTPKGSAAGLPRDATFEFNDNSLVAIRADVPVSEPIASGPPVDAELNEVIGRDARGDTVHLTVLSRTCSEHLAETAGLLASRRASAIRSVGEP